MKKTGVAVLGATGSIGSSTARILEQLSGQFRVTALVGRTHTAELARQAALFRPDTTISTDETRKDELSALMPDGLDAEAGMEPVLRAVVAPETDIVVCAIVGTGGLEPVVAALRAGKRVALASKEVLVMAGEIIQRELAASPGGEIIPVDSEHSAIFQCLAGRPDREVKNLFLTASGGAFRDWSREQIAEATVKDALAHPTWSMGPKVTIDSASLMNKALELVEARHLFGVPPERIKVLVHPQSIVHSMIELCDGSFIAQMAPPDMRFAIQYALTYPERSAAGNLPELDFSERLKLEFQLPDRTKYPSLDFADEAMRRGGTLPAVMNAANEVAVERFRRGEIKFPAIWRIIEQTMASHRVMPQDCFETIRQADREARRRAAEIACD